MLLGRSYRGYVKFIISQYPKNNHGISGKFSVFRRRYDKNILNFISTHEQCDGRMGGITILFGTRCPLIQLMLIFLLLFNVELQNVVDIYSFIKCSRRNTNIENIRKMSTKNLRKTSEKPLETENLSRTSYFSITLQLN